MANTDQIVQVRVYADDGKWETVEKWWMRSDADLRDLYLATYDVIEDHARSQVAYIREQYPDAVLIHTLGEVE